MKTDKSKNRNDKDMTPVKEVQKAIYKTVDDYVTQFGMKFSAGIAAIAEAGRIYAEAILHHPSTAADRFKATYPSVGERTWDMLRHIGNGDLNPHAMLLPPKVADKVRIMNRKQQDALFNQSQNGIRCLTAGGYETDVELQKLTTMQFSVAVDEKSGRIRTIQEQHEIFDKIKSNRVKGVHGRIVRGEGFAPYRIVGRTLRIGTVEIGINELKKIISTMENNTKNR